MPRIFSHKLVRELNLAREIDEWMPQGIKSLIEGSYSPRLLKRYYFSDEMVDQLHVSDRIFQHVLLKQLKPTFSYVMNKNCYHLHDPTGVKYASERIKKVLEEEKPEYVIRADIKSYKSIPHFKLIQDIKKYYDDPKLLMMLEEIITNPIDTPYGYKNPVRGIALRGPLSQFFSGLYLKPLDDALPHQQAALRMIPHARTLRKAREQVKSMVTDGASPRHIRKYLARWIQ